MFYNILIYREDKGLRLCSGYSTRLVRRQTRDRSHSGASEKASSFNFIYCNLRIRMWKNFIHLPCG
ncbi:hypothetical protein SK128_027053 [Halocaridina rubra]|uniref:Uncharacterized protein n=1 Tax=Halocaridina rubra TaxID=373956 RepID=A0AAN8WZX7_HALRR